MQFNIQLMLVTCAVVPVVWLGSMANVCRARAERQAAVVKIERTVVEDSSEGVSQDDGPKHQ